MKMSGFKFGLDIMLLASAVDRLSTLMWLQSESGMSGSNRPPSILKNLLGEEDAKETEAFDTPDEFEKAKRRILERRNGRCAEQP